MEIKFIITISIACGVLCLLSFLYYIFKSVRNTLEEYIQNRFDKKEIIGATTRANFFGQKSKGSKQIRGNGAIVLTKENVFFFRAAPFKEYIIPIHSVERVSMPKSFNGKSIFSKLLCIHYSVDGAEEAIAWAVKNPEKWKESIEKLMSQDQ